METEYDDTFAFVSNAFVIEQREKFVFDIPLEHLIDVFEISAKQNNLEIQFIGPFIHYKEGEFDKARAIIFKSTQLN